MFRSNWRSSDWDSDNADFTPPKPAESCAPDADAWRIAVGCTEHDASWRGDQHLEDWPEHEAGPEYWLFKSRAEHGQIRSSSSDSQRRSTMSPEYRSGPQQPSEMEDELCRCRCHAYCEPSGGVRRTDPVAAVLACDVCRHLHCPALSSRHLWQPPWPPE